MVRLLRAKFKELALIGSYGKGRLFDEAKLITGIRGFNFKIE